MTDLRNALDALAGMEDLRRELDVLERDRIAAAREAGASWERIATALGIRSRQGAQQRYTHLVEATAEPTTPKDNS